MGLTHYLGGARAAARYARKHGHPAKNNYGSSLFRGVRRRWADLGGQHRRRDSRIFRATTLDGRGWLTSVPVLREFLVSNLVLVLKPQ